MAAEFRNAIIQLASASHFASTDCRHLLHNVIMKVRVVQAIGGSFSPNYVLSAFTKHADESVSIGIFVDIGSGRQLGWRKHLYQ